MQITVREIVAWLRGNAGLMDNDPLWTAADILAKAPLERKLFVPERDAQSLRQIIINLTNAAAIVLSRIDGLGDEYKGYILRDEIKWALRDAGIKEGDSS